MNHTLQIANVLIIKDIIFVVSWYESGLWFITTCNGEGQARTSREATGGTEAGKTDPAAGMQMKRQSGADDSVFLKGVRRLYLT